MVSLRVHGKQYDYDVTRLKIIHYQDPAVHFISG